MKNINIYRILSFDEDILHACTHTCTISNAECDFSYKSIISFNKIDFENPRFVRIFKF